MRIVADTSPLNYLILLGHADLLHGLYGQVFVPRAVLSELSDLKAPPEVRSWAASPPAWLEVQDVLILDDSLDASLGAGEREAISLAMELRADLLLIDERAGREQAEARHINVSGTLAVLLDGSWRGGLDFPALLDSLRRTSFRISPKLVDYMLARHAAGRGNT